MRGRTLRTGTTVVTVTFKNIKTAKSTAKKYRCVVKAAIEPEKPVDETTKISAVKQNTFTEFTVTMSKALETVAAADFSMVRDDDNQVITVKGAALDATDKTKVKLTVYTSLTDAKTYTVTYTAADEAKTQSSVKVTVTDGVVADVNITPVEITANVETLIEYQTLDANGVIVSQRGAAKPESKVDVTWDSLLGTMNNGNSGYILYNIGDTAKFTVTYHTYKYDTTTGAEVGVITKDFTVTAVKDASVISQYVYTAALDGQRPYDWSKVTPRQTIAVDDEGAQQRRAYFLIKDSRGKDVTKSCGYTVESSDNSIVVADGDVKDGAKLSPVAKGSAYLMIKDADGKVVNTMPITVGDKRTISTFKLSAPVVNIVSSAAFTGSLDTGDVACGYTDITAKDQYGDDIALADLDWENKTNNGVAKLAKATDNSYICVEGADSATKGYDNYVIKATDGLGKSMTTSLRVNSIEPSGTTTYSVVFLDKASKVVTSAETTVPETTDLTDTTDNKELTAVIVKKQSGVVVGPADSFSVKSMKVTKNDGTVVASVVSGQAAKAVSGDAIDDSEVLNATGASIAAANADRFTAKIREVASSTTTKNLGVGTYTVVFEIIRSDGKDDKASASFTVVDKQTSVTAKVKDTYFKSTSGDIQDVFNDPDKAYVEFYYGDTLIESGIETVAKTDVKYTISNGDKNAYVKDVTITIPVANSNNKMKVKVPVNKTFVTTGLKWDND